MPNYTIIDSLKEGDFRYVHFLLEEWYLDNISWRIHHHILRERCDTCRNWHFCGKWEGRMMGACDIFTGSWQDFHGHCWCWNIDPDEDQSYSREDGWERTWNTPLGKKIVQISKGGVWQYEYDGELEF